MAAVFHACACATLPAAPLPDISTVPADPSVPELVDGPPGAGKRVSLELFQDTPPVILCGFSRGAIAANAIGLHDDEIAALWRGLVCYSHYDGLSSRWPFAGKDVNSVRQRLARLNGRPQLSCCESTITGTRSHLENTGVKGDFTFLDTGFRNHNDAWTLRPSAARDTARAWLADVIHQPSVR